MTMTDLAAQFAPDVSNLDAQFQTIQHVSSNWGLPALPDDVTLDLMASPAITSAQEQQEFLTGLAADLEEAENPPPPPPDPGFYVPAVPGPGLQTPGVHQAESANVQELRRQFAGIASVRAPEILSGDPSYAVRAAKAEMIADGLLDPSTPLDGGWSPELTAARRRYLNLEAGRRIQGERPGAVSTNRVLQFMDDWFSPGNLAMSAWAAMNPANLVQDVAEGASNLFESIGEFATNPSWDTFGGMVSTIDDVAIPVLNTYLTLSGFRGLLLFSPTTAGLAGGFKTFGRYDPARLMIGTAGSAVRERALFQTPGLISQQLTKHGMKAAGGWMADWRRYSSVVMTKKAVQQAAKVGFIAQLEAQPFTVGLPFTGVDYRHEGFGLHGDRIRQFKDFRTSNPLGLAVTQAMDIPFAPTTIFVPGTAVRPLRRAGKALSKRLIELQSNEVVAAATFNGMLDWYQANHPETYRRAVKIARKGSPGDANLYMLTGVDPTDALTTPAMIADAKELAGEKLLYIVGSAAIHKVAHNTAVDLGYQPGSPQYRQAYLTVKDHYIARLRPYDWDELPMTERPALVKKTRRGKIVKGRSRPRQVIKGQQDMFAGGEEVLDPIAAKQFIDHHSGVMSVDLDLDEFGILVDPTQKPKGIVKNRRGEMTVARNDAKKAMEDFLGEDPAGFKELGDLLIGHHNELRNGSWHDIVDGLTEADIALYLGDVMPSIDRWDSWTTDVQILNEFVADNLGQLKVIFPSKIEQVWEPSWLEEVELAGRFLPEKKATNGLWNGLAQRLNAGDSAVTVALENTVTKQDAVLWRRRIEELRRVREALGDLEPNETLRFDDLWKAGIEEHAAKLGKEVKDLSGHEIRDWVNESRKVRSAAASGPGSAQAAMGATRKEQIHYVRALQRLQREGFESGTDGARWLDQQLGRITNSDFWRQAGVYPTVLDETTNSMRPRTLDELMSQLRRHERFLASEMQVPDEVAQYLASNGYKAVVGRDFLFDSDLASLDGPFLEVTRRQLRRRSLGLFISRAGNGMDEITKLRRHRAELGLNREIKRAIAAGTWDGPDWDFDLGSDDLAFMLRSLEDHKTQIRRTAKQAEDAASTRFDKVLTRGRNSGLPFTTYDLREDQIAWALNGDPDFLAPDATPLWGKKSLKVVADGLKDGKFIGWERQGLTAWQEKLITESWLRSALGVFKFSEAADDAEKASELRRALGIAKKGFGFGRNGAPRDQLDLFKGYQRAGMGLLGGAAGVAWTSAKDEDQDWFDYGRNALFGAAAFQFDPLMNPRTALRGGLGYYAGAMAESEGASSEGQIAAAFLGATAGTAVIRGTAHVLAKHGGVLDMVGWRNYSKLGESLMSLRDRVRFSLSPVFDLQRYTEGMVLSATETGLPGGQLPITHRPMHHAMKATGLSADEVMHNYRVASGGQDWMEAVDSTQAWFYERGIMGFSPTEWMAASHAQLVHRGMDPAEAADRVREIFTYGVRGRSGLEMSANFIFFPFSFQKKYLTQVGSFMMEDMGRTMLIHDSLKGYEMLSERYDLSERWRDRMPILGQLRKMNSLAFGISPGQFGGINRPYLDMIRATPQVNEMYDFVVNAFLPQAVRLDSKADAEELKRTMGRVIPIWRDGMDLLDDMKNQGHVVTSPAHLSREADAQRGWEMYRDLRADVAQAAEAAGVSMSSLLSGQGRYAPIRVWYDGKVADIQKQHPYWKTSRVKAAQSAVAKQAEINDIVRSPENQGELAMAQFDQVMKQALSVIGEATGGDFEYNSDLMPPEITEALRAEAVRLSVEFDGFGALYRRYYQGMLGPIHRQLR